MRGRAGHLRRESDTFFIFHHFVSLEGCETVNERVGTLYDATQIQKRLEK